MDKEFDNKQYKNIPGEGKGTMKRKAKTIWIIVIAVVILIAGFVCLRKIDGIYARICAAKTQYKESREYILRHREQTTLDGLGKLTDEEDAWYVKYHFISHSGGGVEGRTCTNSKQAWKLSYQNGNRVMGADCIFTMDNVLVLWYDPKNNLEINDSDSNTNLNTTATIAGEQEYDIFYNRKIFHKFDPMSFQDAIEFMDEHEDVFVACNAQKKYFEKTYQYIVDMCREQGNEELLNRIIVNVYDFEDYDKIRVIYPFENFVLFQQYGKMNNYSDIIKFCIDNQIHIVNVSAEYAEDEGIKMLKNYGIHVYCNVVDYISDMKEYRKSGIDGAVTNWLYEADWSLIEENGEE